MKKQKIKRNGQVMFILAASAAMSGVMGLYTLLFSSEDQSENVPDPIHAEQSPYGEEEEPSHADIPETDPSVTEELL